MTKPVYRPPAHLIIWGVMLWVLIVVVLGYTGDRVYRWATTPSIEQKAE